MKVGLILECAPQGADQQVCEYLAARLNPDLELHSATLVIGQRHFLCGCLT